MSRYIKNPTEEMIRECKRESLKAAYYEAMSEVYFEGEVSQIKDGRYMFKRINIHYFDCEGNGKIGREEHFWIVKEEELQKNNVKKGDNISFSGTLYVYKRKNGTYELGVENVRDIEKMESYDLVSDEALEYQFLAELECELCLFRDHCNGLFCLKR